MKFTKKLLYYPALLLLIILTITIIILIHKKSTSYEGRIYTAVGSEIIIERGESGIPVVKADTLNDAYFSIGFLHGQDRLALVEYFRAIARGRLSELIGKDGIFLDKLSLTIGLQGKRGIFLVN
jgi:penicillin amidase